MKERISNILAWIGFSYPILVAVSLLIGLNNIGSLLLPRFTWRLDDVEFLGFLFAVYLGCGLVNYVLSGRMKLVPWK
jgi:hypothetical protein